MVKYCIYLVVWLMATTAAFAQSETEVDSLKKELTTHAERDSIQLRIYLRLASALRHSATDEALAYANQALTIADSLQLEVPKASAQQILGLIYNIRMDYRNSLFFTFQALRSYEKLKLRDGEGFAYNAIGLVYANMKKLDMAKRYYQKAIALLSIEGNHSQLGMIYNNMGNILTSEHNIEASILYYKKALAHEIKFGDTRGSLASIYINIGDAYLDLNQLDSATVYLHKGLTRSSSSHPDKYAMAYCFYNLGKVALKQHRIQQAESYLSHSRQMAEDGGMRELQLDIYYTLIGFYKEKQDINRLYEYTNKYNLMKDSIYNETTVRQINEMQEAYQVEKRDQKIELLNQKQQILEANAANQRLIRNFTVSGLLLLLLIGIVIARNVVLKQRVNNRVLSEKNAIAEKNIVQLNHENTLAKFEAMKSKTDPHFLFNSLTTLSSIVLEDPKQAVTYIKQFSHLFRMVLEFSDHQTVTLEKELEVVNSYIYLQRIRFGNSLHVSISIEESYKHTLIPPFALQLLIENAIKHNVISQNCPLHISVSCEHDYIVVQNGLQKRSSTAPSTSTGHKSIKERYRILSDRQPVFAETSIAYIVKLPVLRTISIQPAQSPIV